MHSLSCHSLSFQFIACRSCSPISFHFCAMSLSELPLECLQGILEHLRGDKPTLSRLLRTNSYLCTVTLPYLYDQAFCVTSITTHRAALVDAKRVQIVQTLLRQRPAKEISKLLDAAYDVFPTNDRSGVNMDSQQLRTSTIDYLSNLNSFGFNEVIYLPRYGPFGENVDHWQCYPPRLADYVFRAKSVSRNEMGGKKEEEHSGVEGKDEDNNGGKFISALAYGTGLHDEDLDFPMQPRVPMRIDCQRYAALATTLRRELTWTLCSPVLEKIQEIILPLSDLDRYLGVLHRFQSLRMVSFDMDQALGPGPPDGNGQLDQGRVRETTESDKERHRQLENMVAFVEQHGRLFPNQLRDAHCPVAHTWKPSLVCPPDFYNRMKDALPMIICPKIVNQENWERVARKINKIDLGSVECVNLLRDELLTPILKGDPQFLGRCRALKTLGLKSRDAVSFQWAVQEKRTWDQYQMKLQSHDVLPITTWVNPELPLRPAPVENITILTHGMITNELDNIAEAFGKTLRSVDVHVEPHRHDSTLPDVNIGTGWRLPEIMSLVVSMTCARLLVDQYLLQRGLGPKLEYLRLWDNSLPNYHHHEFCPIRPATEPMLKLKGLSLHGRPALVFDPSTLHQTPNLQTLALTAYHTLTPRFRVLTPEELEDSIFFVDSDPLLPSTGDEMETDRQPLIQRQRRPRWTWDWHLPHLQSLTLNAMFAFLFEFRMLAHCPSLQYMQLYINSSSEDDKRILTLQEFSTYSVHSDGKDNTIQLIVAPSMQTLYFYGPWCLEDELRAVLFKTTFPNLEVLTEYYTIGYSPWEGWIAPLRRKEMPRLRKVSRWIGSSEAGCEHTTIAENIMADHGMVLKDTWTQGSASERDVRSQYRRSGLKHESKEVEAEDTAIDYQLNGRAWVFPEENTAIFP